MGHDDGSLEKPWPGQRIEPKELRLASTARALTASLVRTVPALVDVLFTYHAATAATTGGLWSEAWSSQHLGQQQGSLL